MAPPTFEEFFKNLPYVTKYLIIGSFAMTAMVSLKITKASNYLLDFDMIFDIYKIQVWRLLTNLFFFGGFSFNWVMNFFFFVDYCKKVETEVFDGRTADFIFMLIFGCSLMTIAAYFLDIQLLSFSLLLYLVYVWCNKNDNYNLSLFMIPLQVRSIYFPWALMLLHMIMGGSLIYDLIGIVAGHAYYFLAYIFPDKYGYRILKTPGLLYSIFPPERASNLRGFSVGEPAQGVRNPFPQAFHGRGRALNE